MSKMMRYIILARKMWWFRIALSWMLASVCICVPVCVPVGVGELTSVQANAPHGSARLQQLWVWESPGYSAVNSSQSHKDKVNGPLSSLIRPLETITFHIEHYDFSATLIWIADFMFSGKTVQRFCMKSHKEEYIVINSDVTLSNTTQSKPPLLKLWKSVSHPINPCVQQPETFLVPNIII